MKREHIVLRTGSIAADITKPRLLDSNGKRKSNNKIAIYSHKYSNLMSTHSLPEGSNEQHPPMSPFLKTSSDLASTQMYDSDSQRFSYEPKKESEKIVPLMSDQNLFAAVREQMNNIRSQYQAKMKEMLEGNARTICQLRQMLTQQQRKVAQKQLLIQKLIAQNQRNSSAKKILNNTQAKSNAKLNESQFSYLKSRMHDIDIKLMVLIDAMSTNQRQTSSKLSFLQQKLIRNTGKRLFHCKSNLQIVISQFARKITTIEYALSLQVNQPSKIAFNQYVSTDTLKSSIIELQKKIQSFCNKQWKYQCPQLQRLQNMLQNMTEKLKEGKNSLASKDNNYYFQDQDEFFYPSTERVYEPSDDYEHFQQDSQDEGFKKQNQSPNCGLSSKKES